MTSPESLTAFFFSSESSKNEMSSGFILVLQSLTFLVVVWLAVSNGLWPGSLADK